MDPRSRPIVVALLVAFIAINFADKAVLGLSSGQIIREFGLSNTAFGAIGSSFFALFSISALIFSRLADRGRPAMLLGAMALLWSAALLLGAVAGSAGVLVASRVLLGAGEGPAFPIAAYVALNGQRERAYPRVSGFLTAGAPLGITLAAIFCTMIIVRFGWRAAFVSLALAGGVWLGIWIAIARRSGVARISGASSANEHVPRLTAVLFQRPMIGVMLATFAAYTANAIAVVWLPRVLESGGGFSPASAGAVLAVGWAAQIPVALAGGAILAAVTRRVADPLIAYARVSAVALGIAGVSLAAIAGFGLPGLTVLFVIANLVATIVVFTVSVPIAAEVVPESMRGTALGAVVAVYSIAGILGPVFFGAVADRSGNPAAGIAIALMVCGGAIAVAAVAGGLLIRAGRRAPAAGRAAT